MGGARGPSIALTGAKEADLVTVDIHYSGVNYADVCIRWGLYSSQKAFAPFPMVPGFEFSGLCTVECRGLGTDGGPFILSVLGH